MNNNTATYYSKENFIDTETKAIINILNSDYTEYEKFLLLLNKEKILKIAIEDISEADENLLRFLRNSIIHGPQYQFKDILDQMFRYDIRGEILYLDFDIKENTNTNELCKMIENSEILLYSKNFDEPLTHSVYNKVTMYGLTLSLNMKNFNNYIKEKLLNDN